MTSTQFMQTTWVRLTAWLSVTLALTSCGPRLVQPDKLQAPYVTEQLWAVAPFSNESGVSGVDTDRVADHFVQQLQDVHGINAVPVNRVIAAMRELEIDGVRQPSDAQSLMDVLGVEGLIIGTVTAYDPYRPMTFGAAIELHMADHRAQTMWLDTRKLTRSPTGDVAPVAYGPTNPVAQAAGIFDAGNHETLMQLDRFAAGRSSPDSAFGEDAYLVRMDLYTQFVSYRLLRDLLNSEWKRERPIVEQSPNR